MCVLTENWYSRYLGGADFEFGVLKFRPQNAFLGEFGPKKSKLSILSEKWHLRYVEDADSYSNISFLNFQTLTHFWANWHTEYLEDTDFYSDISFLNFQSFIHFWANLGRKSQSCSFCLKIGTYTHIHAHTHKHLLLVALIFLSQLKVKTEAINKRIFLIKISFLVLKLSLKSKNCCFNQTLKQDQGCT